MKYQYSRLIFLIIFFSCFDHINCMEEYDCPFCLVEGSHVLESYNEFIDALEDKDTSLTCPLSERSISSQSNFCRRSVIEAASSYFYSHNIEAQLSMDRSLKSSGGNWSIGEIYYKNINKNSQVISMNNSLGDSAKITFPKRDWNESIRVDVIDNKGQVKSCEYPFSQDIYDMNSTTKKKWDTLSAYEKFQWQLFCKEHIPYEKKALYFEQHDWKIESRGGQSDEEYYNRCPAGLNWKNLAAKALCGEGGRGAYPLINSRYIENFPNLKVPKSFMTFFDGYGDFSGDKALKYTNAQNVTGREKGDAIMGFKNANGLSFYYSTIAKNRNAEDIQFLYYDGSGQKISHDSYAAANCHNDMDKWLKVIKSIYPEVKMPKRVVMGYSNGGVAALDFQRQVSKFGFFSLREKKEAQVDLLVTIDPIARPAAFALNKATGISLFSKRRATTTRYINIYQTSDYGSFKSLRLTSEPISGADDNIYISPKEMGEKNGKLAHVKILKTFSVQDRVQCEFNNAIGEAFNLCI